LPRGGDRDPYDADGLRTATWTSPGEAASVASRCPRRFRYHFSHAWLDHGGAEGDLMVLNGWTSPQMLRRYGASARSARARRSYDRVMQAVRNVTRPRNQPTADAASRNVTTDRITTTRDPPLGAAVIVRRAC
jgi:hypothetical protein